MTWLREYGLLLGVIAVVFQSGVVFANYLYMRKSMVTKKDMEIALLRLEKKFSEKYMDKEETAKEFQLCRALHHGSKKVNGGLLEQTH